MSRVFSREKFYELVWSKPMTHLAKEFGLSDVALHKICRKHDIPNPPPGWWAKKEAGKKVTQTPLPKVRDDNSDTITIVGAELGRQPEALVVAQEQARIVASASIADDPVVSHPIVDRTIAALRKSKPGPKGLALVDETGLIRCEVAPSSIERLSKLLNRIMAAAAQQDFRLAADIGVAHFVGDKEFVSFSVVETVKRVKCELTDEERAQEEQRLRKLERQRLRNEWDSVFISRPDFPEWDYHATGQLSFEFEHIYVLGGSSPRRSFRDAKIQRLEDMAVDIAVGLVVLATAKTQERLRREAEQRRMDEQRRLREEALRRKHIEERRISELERILAKLEEVDRLRRLLTGLRDSGRCPTDPRIAEFLRWSEWHLAEDETGLGVEHLAKHFLDQRLFGDDDDHAFKSQRWF